jgi:hypothetical protein
VGIRHGNDGDAVAIFRLSAQLVKRSEGRSATAAASYRAGIRMHDERTGLVFDYTRRRGVVHAEILAPEDAPAWVQDRARLWNAVEAIEKRKDAQLARELQLALPHELTARQRLNLARQFVRAEFVAHGMIADLSIHRPDRQGDHRNHHAHVMLTLRAITASGFGKKTRAWNDVAELERWRASWSAAVNHALAGCDVTDRVDHRSYAERDIDREPEPKIGPVATTMERQGQPSRAGAEHRATRARNERRAELVATLVDTTVELAALDMEDHRSGNVSATETPVGTPPAVQRLGVPPSAPIKLPVRRPTTAGWKLYLFAMWSTLARAVTTPMRALAASAKRRRHRLMPSR